MKKKIIIIFALMASGYVAKGMERMRGPGEEAYGTVEESLQKELVRAISRGSLEELEKAVSRGANIYAQDRDGLTPMHVAAAYGQAPILEWLFMHNADINVRSRKGLTPMHFAATKNKLAALEWLLAHGADFNARDNTNGAPIHYAATTDQIDSLEWLLAHGADVNARDDNDATPAHYAARNGNIATLEWLLARNGNIYAQDNRGALPIHYAATKSQVDALEWLFDRLNDINARNASGQTPLHYAVERGQIRALPWLLANGADIHARTNDGEALVHLAAMNDHIEELEWLLVNGQDMLAQNNYGLTAADYAAHNGKLDAILWFIEHGFSSHLWYANLFTKRSLQHAVLKGDIEKVVALLKTLPIDPAAQEQLEHAWLLMIALHQQDLAMYVLNNMEERISNKLLYSAIEIAVANNTLLVSEELYKILKARVDAEKITREEFSQLIGELLYRAAITGREQIASYIIDRERPQLDLARTGEDIGRFLSTAFHLFPERREAIIRIAQTMRDVFEFQEENLIRELRQRLPSTELASLLPLLYS